MVLVYLKNLAFPPQRPLLKKYRNSDLESPSLLTSAADDDTSPFDDKAADAQHPHASCSSRRIDPRVVSDAIIGLSDGLTVPFALTAGLSALGSTRVVVSGGLAELTAGAISMGLGGYLAARSEAEAHAALSASTAALVAHSPARTAALLHSTLATHIPALTHPSAPVPLATLTTHIQRTSPPADLAAFLLAFHHNAGAAPDAGRGALASAATIAGAYFVGGFVPLLPYLFCEEVGQGFRWSVGVVVVCLFVFGCVRWWVVAGGFEENEERGSKGRGRRRVGECVKGGAEMVVLGGVAGGAAMALVKAFG